jgi:hypothetical protein
VIQYRTALICMEYHKPKKEMPLFFLEINHSSLLMKLFFMLYAKVVTIYFTTVFFSLFLCFPCVTFTYKNFYEFLSRLLNYETSFSYEILFVTSSENFKKFFVSLFLVFGFKLWNIFIGRSNIQSENNIPQQGGKTRHNNFEGWNTMGEIVTLCFRLNILNN